ncbi:WD40 repeat domain-containing protein [Streptomyces sp. NPDC053474]|uniref:WD40 repeat domain-containing protein n=1 Tax=Streptomyces sp. NPDC053474 TaxID=3365704 RepID=UPI0037CE7EB1
MRGVLGAALVACALTTALPGAASAEPTGGARETGAGVERVSVAADGTQFSGDSTGGAITTDGRRVVFSSADRVYLRDAPSGQLKQVGSYPIASPAISGDGEYAAYAVLLFRDTKVKLAQWTAGSSIGLNCDALNCSQPSVSGDGRYVANVATIGRPSSSQRIDVWDWHAGTKQELAWFDHTAPSRPSISGDGRFVAYQDGKAKDVFLWDRDYGSTSDPIEGPSQEATLVQLSEDGSKVVYLSGSDTYVHDVSSGTAQRVPNVKGLAIDPTGSYLLYAPNDPTGPSLVLRDLRAGTDEVVSHRPASAGVDAVSAGGREVVFQSTADDIVPGDTNGTSDVFVRRFS